MFGEHFLQTDFQFYYLIISVGLSFVYLFIISLYLIGWKKTPIWEIPKDFEPNTFVSILIPARNEAENILNCLNSILNQNYPKTYFEIIVIDDFSDDETVEIVENYIKNLPTGTSKAVGRGSLFPKGTPSERVRGAGSEIKIIRLADHIQESQTQSFKKKAIEIGIQQSKGDLIVTTDADCFAQKSWLSLLVSFYEKQNLKFIAAPVNFHHEKNLLERFQSLDFSGMMCVTAAGIQLSLGNMCNGANLAYEKNAFYNVKGFEGVDHIASGDDMLLMQKIAAKYPGKIGFLKNQEATVLTNAKPTISTFLSQRIRWASKSTSYKEWRITFILSLVFFFCLNIFISLLLIPFWGLFAFFVFAWQFFLKTIVDYIFLGTMTRFFNRKDLMLSYFQSQFLHIAYIVIVGILGNLVKKYEWKGRKVH